MVRIHNIPHFESCIITVKLSLLECQCYLRCAFVQVIHKISICTRININKVYCILNSVHAFENINLPWSCYCLNINVIYAVHLFRSCIKCQSAFWFNINTAVMFYTLVMYRNIRVLFSLKTNKATIFYMLFKQMGYLSDFWKQISFCYYFLM